uniref:ABC transporter domain-containing protein n=1 Tax=Corethron hystrix TaxID=216773 RepID=A0A7S1BD08_9STRA
MAFAYLKRHARACGRDCIQVSKKLIVVSELACAVCVTRCKQCPGDAVSVVKLPANLTTDTTHRYGPNSFKIHGLPVPRPGHVLGLLGTNGTGKSTALSILLGRIKPNLGRTAPPAPDWADIVKYYRGSDLQNYFSGLLENKLRVVIKPQLEASFARRLKGKNVRELMKMRDERKIMDKVVKELELGNVLDREVTQLSGGELQRFAVGCTLCRDADVYMFDEATSFLDVKQRLRVTEKIRDLVHNKDDWPGGEMEAGRKYVIVVEHDLAILDYMSDYVQCLYGASGAYGVVTGRARVRNGINQFLAGYIASENMRFRANELTFKVKSTDFVIGKDDVEEGESVDPAKSASEKLGLIQYPHMSKSFTKEVDGKVKPSFTLKIEPGNFRDREVICLMGENGTGKTTFMELLAGRSKEQRGKEATIGSYAAAEIENGVNPSLSALGVAYKMQTASPKMRKFTGTVQEIMERDINAALGDRLFRLLVIKALNVDALADLRVQSLSGGEMQRLAIVLCLGTPARIYLIDEPSAGLDCEQRVIAAKVMKRWIINHLGRTIFLVEHDFLMATAMADRVIVYTGTPGVECTASAPMSVAEGFNSFLKNLNVTFRRDPINYRPRINKPGSRKDQLQKKAGEYYLFDVDEEEDDFDDL